MNHCVNLLPPPTTPLHLQNAPPLTEASLPSSSSFEAPSSIQVLFRRYEEYAIGVQTRSVPISRSPLTDSDRSFYFFNSVLQTEGGGLLSHGGKHTDHAVASKYYADLIAGLGLMEADWKNRLKNCTGIINAHVLMYRKEGRLGAHRDNTSSLTLRLTLVSKAGECFHVMFMYMLTILTTMTQTHKHTHTHQDTV